MDESDDSDDSDVTLFCSHKQMAKKRKQADATAKPKAKSTKATPSRHSAHAALQRRPHHRAATDLRTGSAEKLAEKWAVLGSVGH